MIKNLTLTKYGKFAGKSFSFSAVTVFYGRNEAGKTTIFDAIFEKLCNPKGTSSISRELKKRYGEPQNRVLTITYGNGEFKYGEDEFLNLYAVKSGDITTNLSSGSDWVSKIQSSLFTGGIDPGVLCEQLEYEASDKKSVAHMRLLKKKQSELKDKEEILQEKLNERDAILKSEKEINKSSDAMFLLSKDINEKTKKQEKLKESIATQEKIREKNKLFSILKKIEDISVCRKKLESLSIYGKDLSADTVKLVDAVQNAKKDRAYFDAVVKSAGQEIEELEKDLNDLQTGANALSMKITPLNELLEQIEREHPKVVIRQSTAWNKPLAAIGLLFAATGAVVGALMEFSSLGIVLMTVGIFAGVGILYVSRKNITKEETPDIEKFTKRMLKRWHEIVGSAGQKFDSVSDLREGIIKLKSGYTQSQNSHKQLSERIKGKKESLKITKSDLQNAKELQRDSEIALQGWFEKMKVVDLKQYGARISEYTTNKNLVSSLESDLNKEMTYYQCESVDALKIKTETLAAQHEKNLSGIKAVSDAELVKLKNMDHELSAEIDSLRTQERLISDKFNKSTGQISGALGNLPEIIADLQRQIAVLFAEIRDLDLNRRAAGFAAGIFKGISQDSSMQFGIISKDIACRFGEFLSGVDSVKLSSFNNNDIEVMDAGGVFRPPEQLSTGTRDAFWLAARLSLALKTNPEGPGIIVLDEPFHAFDNDRVEKAISLLKKFHDNSDWQLILFTKDEYVGTTMKRVFKDEMILHELQ